MRPEQIAARALQHVGTPFRLYGRDPEYALDCVGLTAAVIGINEGWRYSLKGEYLPTIERCLCAQHFLKMGSGSPPQNGDIALVQCAPRQQHLMIRAEEGWVQAHAGLGRVVHMPGNSPWPIIALWSMTWQL